MAEGSEKRRRQYTRFSAVFSGGNARLAARGPLPWAAGNSNSTISPTANSLTKCPQARRSGSKPGRDRRRGNRALADGPRGNSTRSRSTAAFRWPAGYDSASKHGLSDASGCSPTSLRTGSDRQRGNAVVRRLATGQNRCRFSEDSGLLQTVCLLLSSRRSNSSPELVGELLHDAFRERVGHVQDMLVNGVEGLDVSIPIFG